MTDYAREVLAEEEHEAPVLSGTWAQDATVRTRIPGNAARAAETAHRQPPAAPAAPAQAVAEDAVAETAAAPEPAPGREAQGRQPEAEEPGREAQGRQPAAEKPGREAQGRQPEAEEPGRGAGVHGTARAPRDPPGEAHRALDGEAERTRLLVAVVRSLSREPTPGPVSALLEAYAAAPDMEVEHATRTVVAVFLRAPAGLRRPMRDALAPALADHVATPLAKRLAVHLAGGAFPRSSPGPSGGEDG